MAFHVACPITCRRICYCSLGFPSGLQNDKGKTGFLEEVDRLKAFLDDPWLIRDNKKTVQVLVPKVAVVSPPPQVTVTPSLVVVDGGRGDAADEMLSAQNKRAAMQKQAAAASLVAEDYARRFESGDPVGFTEDLSRDEQVLSNAKVMCRLCFSGENERSERARKMLSCKSCNKKYHRSCLKAWAHDRDLFHWSSWTCPSCRICEVCRRTGDPNKLMFCKRCDAAYHCYCQHPPHKNVSRGPYLCPKHTRCHSCASTVPGNGSSLRWFLGYTCCDACGRLFVKGNYCPVCLKVYRDSESTPMVCCDICQRWVHCHCDGISDEKYLQFQVNNHLEYRCATCRGECYQVRDLEDAVQELWRRRDKAEQDLIANLRAAAGLPTQEEIFAISPYYSGEEDDGAALKKEYGHSLKFSLKGVVDKSPKEYTKKPSNKYGKEKQFPAPVFGRIEARHSDGQSMTGDDKDEDVQSYRKDMVSFPSLSDAAEVLKRKFVVSSEAPVKRDGKLFGGDSTKERKLVIHLGARNKNVARSDASKSLLDTHNGGEEQRVRVSTFKEGETGGKEGNLKKPNPAFGKRSSSKRSAGGGKHSLRVKFKNKVHSEEEEEEEEDRSFAKGQRSKRKRPAACVVDEGGKDLMDAKWIIQKLGEHAIGKMVEVQQPSNNSWHKGTVIQVSEDASTVSVSLLDNGKAMDVDLGKQGIRFVSQKHR